MLAPDSPNAGKALDNISIWRDKLGLPPEP